jgi:hypothetical protein
MVSLRKLVSVAGLAVLVWAAWQWYAAASRPGGAQDQDRGVVGKAGTQPLPRIGLERLDSERGVTELGQRDLFAFGPPPTLAARPPTPPPARPATVPTPRPAAVAAAPAAAPLQVSYIGKVEGQGARVAVLLRDDKEVLTGREGDLVANRLRIVKIGLESIDVQEVGSDRVRRLPLEGR